eukprot:TRINITY_DN26933_c0_g1_i1.p1 TRINITY_DN26933_c0_g1~~TRINITY_DN26933_c0_g1_i1.p1  ORF type:complete len:296 (-),score=84.51 TRINITY_DN26933_c0_g1_i1:91-978(-)
MESVAETCLRYLMTLVKSKTASVVSESLLAIRHLLQHHTGFVHDGVVAMTHQLAKVTVPEARACIAWVIGEFIDQVPTFGPDALRILLQGFAEEPLEVRMQTLTLGCKVYMNNKEQSEPLVLYLFDLCKYDRSYDLRDKARLLRAALLSGNDVMTDVAIPLLRTQKPPPLMTSAMRDRQRYATGSLSQLVNHTAMGYMPLADFPTSRPDPSVRDAPVNVYGQTAPKKKKKHKQGKPHKDDLDSFYDDENSTDNDSDSQSQCSDCLLYTSDAADDLLCVDIGGRRIIKKKKTTSNS